MQKAFEELAEDGAKYVPRFATMEAKIATSALSILNGDLKRKVELTKLQYARKKPPQMITGREIIWRIYDHNKISQQAHVKKEFQDFISLELRGDNLSLYILSWDECLMYMKNVPPPDILESTFRKQCDRSDKLKEVMTMYAWEIDQKGAKPSCEDLRKD